MLVGAVPFLLMVAWCWQGDRWSLPNLRQRRQWALFALLSVTVIAVMIPVAWTMLHAREGSFSSAYGSGGPVLRRFGDSFAALFFPWAPWEAMSVGAGGLLPNVVFLGCFAVLILARGDRSRQRAMLALGLALCIPFAALYTPWEYVLPFYALPTTIGGAIIVGFAVDHVRSRARSFIPFTVAAAGALVVALKLIFVYADFARGERHIDRALVRHIAADSAATQILVSAERPKEGPQAWTARGPTIVRYASVLTGRPLPPAKEVDCRGLEQLYRSPPAPQQPVLVVLFRQDCAQVIEPSATVIHRFHTLRFWPPEVARDSMGVDLIRLPRASAASAPDSRTGSVAR
ncbi:MAG TPA: hypothetical protein VJ717_02685, partial [Gemmatimonadaceae bacterium]|nr:hypothetical protein [Gemmatimonadaceae bacterium]